jgi:tetratricopeptide (TPR) repeat protein
MYLKANAKQRQHLLSLAKDQLNIQKAVAFLSLSSQEKELQRLDAMSKALDIKSQKDNALLRARQREAELNNRALDKLAEKENSAETWLKAGNRYYYAVQFIKDKTEIPALYQSAAKCFEKSIVISPDNVDAKIMLASCYIEGSDNPMEGIKKLKEIEKTDSVNLKLQLTFAFFSVKSGQLDKAINRFNNVLKIDSNYVEAYLHLADAYEQLGDKIKTIEMLEKYSAKTTDPTAKIEITKYIQQLKNK